MNSDPGRTDDVAPYLVLVRRFAAGEVDARQFEHDFGDLWRRQQFLLPHGMYDIMQELFHANEDFVYYDHLRDPGELDADQFRARVAELEPELVARFGEARRREADDANPPDS